MEVTSVKGKVKFIKADKNRRAILLDNNTTWYSIFKDTKGFPEATGIVEKIDNNVSMGDFITLEVVENDKHFFNIRSLTLEQHVEVGTEKPPDEEAQGILEEQEEQQEKPVKKAKPRGKTTDSVQMLIIAQSTLKAAVETVALYDLNGQKEEIDAEVQRIWGEYFQRVLKLG